jgi:hypothetical protein
VGLSMPEGVTRTKCLPIQTTDLSTDQKQERIRSSRPQGPADGTHKNILQYDQNVLVTAATILASEGIEELEARQTVDNQTG